MTTDIESTKIAHLNTFSTEEVAMVWQLLNTQGIAAPLSSAHIGASVFAKVKAAALDHGIIKA